MTTKKVTINIKQISRHQHRYDLTIQILNTSWSNNDKLMAFIYCDREVINTFLPKLDDFQRLNDNLNLSANGLVQKIREGIKRRQLLPLLMDPETGLAANGYYALNYIFEEQVLTKLTRLLTKSKTPVIEVSCDWFVIPWEWLFNEHPQRYEKKGRLSVAVKSFWAYNRITTKTRFSPRFNNHTHLSSELTLPLKVGLVIDENLTYARSERNWFQSLNDGKQLIVYQFQVHPNSKWDFIEALNRFLNRDDIDIFHFACETTIDPTNPLNSSLRISNNRRYLLKYFQSTPKVEIKSPLIFLNACSTGAKDPTHTFDFVNQFLNSHATSIVAVESSIHSQIALNFARSFYSCLLNGDNVGMSLHKARINTVKKGTNSTDIVSLFYSLYGDPFLQLNKLSKSSISSTI